MLIPAPSQLTVSNGSSCTSNNKLEVNTQSGSSATVPADDDENNNQVPDGETENPTELAPAQEGVKIMKAWRYFKLLEKRNQDMSDPKIGWLPPKEDNKDSVDSSENKDDITDEDEWIDFIENSKSEMRYTEESKAINFALLWAIIDFVFE